ncbi:DUF2971 domain-containing protein [Rhodococcus aetherivorans]|uniref:DUF2971 domain-containing protein n=1 Tax=Rhodococcus aetherivorans TaxID=191292 RepID=UPI00294A849D|nr:DUF2971 domain-containing protein [Rhodococcus aetherivorans]MDV6297227.1 DUF2971 domain-containing protein [Rhodococcus aetherivorans]
MTTAQVTSPLPETLWHYTDAAGLIGILSNEDVAPTPGVVGSGTFKPILWASAAQFLNDRRELVHGLELVKGHIEEVIDPPTGTISPLGTVTPTLMNAKKDFLRELCRAIDAVIERRYEAYIHCCTISFSEDPDVLSQWRAYGGGLGGFSIGFNTSQFPHSDGSRAHVGGLGLHKVSYTSDALEGKLLKAVKGYIDQLLLSPDTPKPTRTRVHREMQSLAFFAASVKHKGFEEEREWRFIEPGFFNPPEFRATPSGLIPYRKIELPASAVTGAWVGPGPNQYENYVAVQSLLHRLGYLAASYNVHCSETPFR